MNKKIGLVLCMITLLLFFNNATFAQEMDKKWGIGARLSYYAPDDTTIEDVSFDPDSSVLFEGNLTYFVNDLFSFEFGTGYTKPDVDAESSGISLEFGELEQIPILLTGRFHYWLPNTSTNFYAGAGVGYYVNDFDLSSLFQTAIPGFNIDSDDSFGFHVNGGVEFFINDNVAFDVDLKYIWNEADFTSTMSGFPPETDEIDLDAFSAGISIKYFF